MSLGESQDDLQETNPLRSNQVCVAIENFVGEQDGDLSFKTGERICIIKPCDLVFWYIAKNQEGKTGMVPSNFLEPLEEESSASALQTTVPSSSNTASSSSSKPSSSSSSTAASKSSAKPSKKPDDEEDGYIRMNPQEIAEAKKADLEVEMAQVKEKHRRLHAGTLVVGTRPFQAQEDSDLSFGVYEEMTILKPLPDLCWYYAQKTDKPSEKGAIPITHIRLVYMSDDEEDTKSAAPPDPSTFDRLYDDVNEFISQSGWFSYPGLPHSKEALHRVLAKKCKMSYEEFMDCKEAVYKFDYSNGEKVFVGKAVSLHVELSKHFDQFETKPNAIRPIDDELCHHTNMGGWNLTVWPVQNGFELETECAKKIIEFDALLSSSADGHGSGVTDYMHFTSKASFDKFWDWFSPP